MADQFSPEWARGVIDGGVQKAQNLMDDPSQVDALLQELQEKMKGLPDTVTKAFSNVPTMIDMVKSYITKEYTEVSPKVIISLVSAFLYLVKRNDIIPDSVPIIGLADDVAIVALAMVINEPEIKAYTAWREQKAQAQASASQPALQQDPMVQKAAPAQTAEEDAAI